MSLGTENQKAIKRCNFHYDEKFKIQWLTYAGEFFVLICYIRLLKEF